MKNKYFLLLILLFIFCKCAAFTRVSPQNNSDSIIIGVSLSISRSVIQEIYFIKLDENDSYLSDKEIIPSNFNIDDKYYLLNAKPGRYIIVAGYNKDVKTNSSGKVTSTKTTIYYYPLEFIKITDITVSKGNIYYLGNHYLWFSPSLSWGINKSDEAQGFYCSRFQPSKVKPDVPSIATDILFEVLTDETDKAIAVKLDKNKKNQLTEIDFWEDTLKGLNGNFFQKRLFKKELAMNEEWMNVINNKLTILKNKETK